MDDVPACSFPISLSDPRKLLRHDRNKDFQSGSLEKEGRDDSKQDGLPSRARFNQALADKWED